jgi:c-di-GMP-binding flagellar brake protein YcgR
MQDERRRFVRLPARLITTYQIVGSRTETASVTRDLSGGGIGFFTETLLPPGTLIKVTVRFPDREKPVAFTGEVMWSGKLIFERVEGQVRSFEAGLRFIDISPQDQAHIQKLASLGQPPAHSAS